MRTRSRRTQDARLCRLSRQQPPPPSIDCLPCDVLHLIAEHVAARDLLSLARACRAFWNVAAAQPRYARMLQLGRSLASDGGAALRAATLTWLGGSLQRVSLRAGSGVVRLSDAQLVSLCSVRALSLAMIDLRCVSFHWGSVATVALAAASDLVELRLTACAMPPGALSAISEAASRSGSVRDLHFDMCDCGKDVAPSACVRVGGALRSLSLVGAGMSTGCCRALALSLRHSAALTMLDLAGNPGVNYGSVGFFGSALRHCGIQMLNLSGCELSGSDSTSLAYYLLRYETSLHTLDLSFNRIGPVVGIEPLCRIVRSPRSMRHLALRANSISDDGAQALVLAAVSAPAPAPALAVGGGGDRLLSLDLRAQMGASRSAAQRLQVVADRQQHTRIFLVSP